VTCRHMKPPRMGAEGVTVDELLDESYLPPMGAEDVDGPR